MQNENLKWDAMLSLTYQEAEEVRKYLDSKAPEVIALYLDGSTNWKRNKDDDYDF